MNDLYFTAKKKKACEDENYPGKACKFNEILLCRMKSRTSLDEIFSLRLQMKSNPPTDEADLVVLKNRESIEAICRVAAGVWSV